MRKNDDTGENEYISDFGNSMRHYGIARLIFAGGILLSPLYLVIVYLIFRFYYTSTYILITLIFFALLGLYVLIRYIHFMFKTQNAGRYTKDINLQNYAKFLRISLITNLIFYSFLVISIVVVILAVGILPSNAFEKMWDWLFSSAKWFFIIFCIILTGIGGLNSIGTMYLLRWIKTWLKKIGDHPQLDEIQFRKDAQKIMFAQILNMMYPLFCIIYKPALSINIGKIILINMGFIQTGTTLKLFYSSESTQNYDKKGLLDSDSPSIIRDDKDYAEYDDLGEFDQPLEEKSRKLEQPKIIKHCPSCNGKLPIDFDGFCPLCGRTVE